MPYKDKAKRADALRAWREKNREKANDQNLRSRERNREKIADRMRRYRQANARKVQAMDRARYKNNPEPKKTSALRYSEEHREKVLERYRLRAASARAIARLESEPLPEPAAPPEPIKAPPAFLQSRKPPVK